MKASYYLSLSLFVSSCISLVLGTQICITVFIMNCSIWHYNGSPLYIIFLYGWLYISDYCWTQSPHISRTFAYPKGEYLTLSGLWTSKSGSHGQSWDVLSTEKVMWTVNSVAGLSPQRSRRYPEKTHFQKLNPERKLLENKWNKEGTLGEVKGSDNKNEVWEEADCAVL